MSERVDPLVVAEERVARHYGLAPAVARRLILFRLCCRARAHYGFSRAEAERLVFWRWLWRRRAPALDVAPPAGSSRARAAPTRAMDGF